MAYGNTHHVEIIQHKATGKIKGEFVTMMLASHRVKGINMPKQPMIKVNHGKDYEFLIALHRNDTVSIENENSERVYYKIQKLNKDGKRIQITLHTDAHEAAKIPKDKTILKSVTTLMSNEYKLKKHYINAIGYPVND